MSPVAIMLDSAKRAENAHRGPPASARSNVPAFMAMDVVAAAARLEAAGRHIGHMQSLGVPSLRRRIARHYDEWHGGEIDPERIVVTTGSSAGFMLAFLALFEPGDRIAIARPSYPPYRNVLAALGCEAVPIEVTAATRFALAPAALLAAHGERPLKGVLVASPANPSGTMMTADALAAVIGAAEDAGIAFISDEIYHGLDYAFPAETAVNVSPNAIVINSFSKYFCMTGWRIG